MKRQKLHSQQSQQEQNESKARKTERLMPKKADYRMRAHINPLNTTTFPYPPHHSFVDWKMHYPLHFGGTSKDNRIVTCNTVEHPSFYQSKRNYQLNGKHVSVVDIGCGFGGLLFGLAPVLSDCLILGMQIRDKVVNFVAEKIRGYRISQPGSYDHIGVVRTNTMRHLCQYFPKGSLDKIFICFPDPHFKAKNYRRRIINTGYLSEYAYLLADNGRLYCITDVLELHQWHLKYLQQHRMFEQVNDPNDPCVKVMVSNTQEGQKVQRNSGEKYWAVYKKRIIQNDICYL